MTEAIGVSALGKSFGGASVLSNLDLEVRSGTIFALLGPNGAGKTTLISILTTLLQPDSGAARVAGYDVVRESVAVRRAIGLTGQSVAVDGALTGEENLRMMGRLAGLSRRDESRRGAELLERFDLVPAARKLTRTYSGGMRRRLDLALSLIVSPPVLFLDEPTTGLDTRSRSELWEVIRAIRDDGSTVFLTTQYLEEADVLADRIALLDNGRIVAEGTAAELKARTGGDVVELRDSDDVLIHEIATDGSLAGLRAAIDELDSRFERGTVSIRRPTLDDVFLALTASERTPA